MVTDDAKRLRAILMQNARPRLGATAVAECGRIFDAAYKQGRADGWDSGFTEGESFACDSVLACFALATHDKFGFGMEQMAEVWEAVQDRMVNEISIREAIEKCEEMGLIIR